MGDLNNQQLILLALLVSFITSIATGIVTVTLMDQAPPGVTQTINRVIEKTVQVIEPTGGQPVREVVTETIIIKEEELVIEAAEKNANNLVQIGVLTKEKTRVNTLDAGMKEATRDTFTSLGGSGFVVTTDGLLLTDLSFVKEENERYAAMTSGETVYAAEVVYRDAANELALLQIKERVAADGRVLPEEKGQPQAQEEARREEGVGFSEITFGDSNKIKVGQTAIALRAHNGVSLLLGVISRLGKGDAEEGNTEDVWRIITTIGLGSQYSGSPLVNIDAEVIGVNIVRQDGTETVPVHVIQKMIEAYKEETESTSAESAGE